MERERASDEATRVFREICKCLDGLNEADARDAVMNAMARVLLVQAPTLGAAFRQARAWHADIRECLKDNWPNIERDRAANGGEQPTVTTH